MVDIYIKHIDMETKNLFRTLLPIILCIAFSVSCSKDDDIAPGFSEAEKEALNVLNGTFAYDDGINTTTIVFTPFSEPVKKKSSMNNVETEFYGSLRYLSKYHEGDYYFYLDTDSEEIIAYIQHSDMADYFNALVGKIWDYEIVNQNTIRLFDTDLSDPLFQTNTYTRK